MMQIHLCLGKSLKYCYEKKISDFHQPSGSFVVFFSFHDIAKICVSLSLIAIDP